MNVGVILAAGQSTRFGEEEFKQFAQLGEKPVINHSLDRFDHSHLIDRYVVVAPPGQLQRARDLTDPDSRTACEGITEGGHTRRLSVHNALQCLSGLNPDTVFVHDSARPGFPEGLLSRLMDEYTRSDVRGVVPGIPLADTIKRLQNDDITIKETLDRSRLRAIQTPQLFDYPLLKSIHSEWPQDKKVTDDAMMIESKDHSVGLVTGARESLKITVEVDLEILTVLLDLVDNE